MSVVKNESKATSLRMVEIDHQQFAVELNNGNVNVNLTQMAKPFGRKKQPAQWLRTDESKSYMGVLSVLHKCSTTDLLRVKQGGENQGTWCTDYRIAMRFAQWLSPEFSIQVDQLLVDLMLGGRPDGTKLIEAEAGIVNDLLFVSRLGDSTTLCIYLNGKLFTKLGPVLKLFGYDSGLNPGQREKAGSENLRQLNVGKQAVWFGNLEAVTAIIKSSTRVIPYKTINTVYKDVFKLEKVGDTEDPYNYHFTNNEMLEIIMLIFDKPIQKEQVVAKLKAGKYDSKKGARP